ncbi:SAM-dependent DNA methyltransferase [Escherichia coli]|nr:SAM-dependent DNA methyltransferase [Escherichia coli]
MVKALARKVKAKKGFEETLWDAANQLRGNVESSEYKHVGACLGFCVNTFSQK